MSGISRIEMKERYANAFIAVNHLIDVDDRKEAASKFGKHINTITAYMKGDIRNIALADKLLVFLKERMEQRKGRLEKFLTAANA